MDNKIVLEVLIVIFGTLAGSIRAVNYARLENRADRAVLAALIAPAFRIPAPVPAGHASSRSVGCRSFQAGEFLPGQWDSAPYLGVARSPPTELD